MAEIAGSHKLRIGDSFSPASKYQYYALRYDFKPASIDPNSPSSLFVNGNEVTVVPDGEKSQTVFKGNKRPCLKEGLLVYDPATGECTIERLNSTLQVKKSRDAAPRVMSMVSSDSLDSSPKHFSSSDKKAASSTSKAFDKRQSSFGNTKKTSPGHTGNSKPAPSRQPVSTGRINNNILKEDLNLSESSDDD